MHHFDQHHIRKAIPVWLPHGAHHYLAHTEQGFSIRALARAANCHPSTVLRQVRRFEGLRDDPLIDEALTRLGSLYTQPPDAGAASDLKDTPPMTAPLTTASFDVTHSNIGDEDRRVLECLSLPNTVLAVAQDMEKAVVVRTLDDGSTTRMAVVDRAVAQTMALRDWIEAEKKGRITRYALTSQGRSAAKAVMADAGGAVVGFAEAQSPFSDQSGATQVQSLDFSRGRLRQTLAESPLAGLARRRDKNGEPFLSEALVAAGERLREDFEFAQMGPRVAKDWDGFLSGKRATGDDTSQGSGPSAARARVADALKDLGPGLGDVILRCCCFLEGMEVAEKRMGWSARSGKIVLRIALQRLQRHYEDRYGKHGPRIG